MEIITHPVTTEHCNAVNTYTSPVTNTNSFIGFTQSLAKKPYIAFSGCVFNHIIASRKLSPSEKFYYLLADSLALISSNSGKQRAVALPSEKWATYLNCSRSQIFSLQKSLEDKGYFVIIKEKNKRGQNKRNLIIPTLPDSVFENLCKSAVCKIGEFSFYNSATECKRSYLDRTRLFIPLNYQLLQTITGDDRLNGLQKIIWLDLFARGVKAKQFSLNISFTELAHQHSCSTKNIAKLVASLQKNHFIRAGRFLVREESFAQERQDKSLWKIDLSLPHHHLQSLLETKDRSNLSAPTNSPEPIGFKKISANPDPLFSKSGLLLNKDLKINIDKNRSIADPNFSKKTNPVSSRSKSKSNFYKISDFKEEIGVKLKELKDFYPLSEEDCSVLQSSSRRDFSLNAMNEILLDMSKRVANRCFNSKKGFLSYMAKVFAYEKRAEIQANNTDFRIKANRSIGELKEAKIEQYLTELEYSLEVSPEIHLKKKLAAVLEPRKAYEFLTSYCGISREGSLFNIHLKRDIELTNNQKQIILNQVKATHENIDFESDNLGFIDELKFIVKVKQNKATTNQSQKTELPLDLPKNIWGDIRRKLINVYGQNIDRNWFSKLEPIIDETTKQITLKVPTNFIRDWIETNYGAPIEQLCQQQCFKLIGVRV